MVYEEYVGGQNNGENQMVVADVPEIAALGLWVEVVEMQSL